jgi:hypothetical protein
MKKLFLALSIFSVLIFASTSVSAKGDAELNQPYESVDNSIIIDRIANEDILVTMPSVIFAFKEVEIKLSFNNPEHNKLLLNQNKLKFIINGEEKELTFENGVATFAMSFAEQNHLSIYIEDYSFSKKVTAYPLWVFLVPIVLIIGFILLKIYKK